MKKIKVLSVDQWTSTGDIAGRKLRDFDLAEVQGGDAEAVRALGIARATILEVSEQDTPSMATVWFREDPKTGTLVQWKYNYDSSG